ncbi:MAG: YceI family protein [Pseudomonadota bacterium]
MKNAVFICLFAALAAGCASLVTPDVKSEPAALRAGQYELDPAHAAVLFKVDHLGFSKYVGRFETVEASLDFDSARPEAAKLTAIVAIESLDVANPSFAETLKGDEWFGAETFPQAVFESRSIEITGENTGRVTGDFTLKGVTRPMTLDVAFNGGARNLITRRYTLGFSAVGTFKRSDHGLDNLIPAIGDDVELEIHAEFLRQ